MTAGDCRRVAPGDGEPGHCRLLVVDDEPGNLALLVRILSQEGYEVLTASGGVEALQLVQDRRPDLVLSDLAMPGGDGLTLCRAIKKDPATRLTPVVLLTALESRDERLKGIDAGADDFIAKPFDRQELRARIRSLVRLKRYTDELDSAEAVIVSLALAIEARDANTDGHCHRLAAYGVDLGRRIGLDTDDLAALQRGGLLHDLGKVAIPDAILLKPSRLTPAEFEQMKRHTVIGDRMCSELRLLHKVRPIVRHHHERLDGTGYPDGVRGAHVPVLAQIIGIVDVFDALTVTRPYRNPMTPAMAFEELEAEVRRGWRDADLVRAFISAQQEHTS